MLAACGRPTNRGGRLRAASQADVGALVWALRPPEGRPDARIATATTGKRRTILHKEVLPSLLEVEQMLTRASHANPAWEPYVQKINIARKCADAAEMLLRQGG